MWRWLDVDGTIETNVKKNDITPTGCPCELVWNNIIRRPRWSRRGWHYRNYRSDLIPENIILSLSAEQIRIPTDCSLVSWSQIFSQTDKQQNLLNWVTKYAWAAINIPGWPSQVTSVCGKHCLYRLTLTQQAIPVINKYCIHALPVLESHYLHLTNHM